MERGRGPGTHPDGDSVPLVAYPLMRCPEGTPWPPVDFALRNYMGAILLTQFCIMFAGGLGGTAGWVRNWGAAGEIRDTRARLGDAEVVEPGERQAFDVWRGEKRVEAALMWDHGGCGGSGVGLGGGASALVN